MFRQLLNEQFPSADARVEVSAGGPRGMRVSMSMAKASQSLAPAVKQLLDAYLFEAQVQVG
ncbi:MAG: fatty-acyl-CoA synthase [Rhodoferax sp.]|jgi:fatty-acyl-CoA synthase